MPRDDYTQDDTEINIRKFNGSLENRLDIPTFVIKNDNGFDSIYLEDIDND